MKFASHYIFTGNGAILPKGIVEVDKQGQILNLTSNEGVLREQAGMEFHSGLICPALPPLFESYSFSELFEKVPALEAFKDQLPANLNAPKAVFEWMKAIQQSHSISLNELIQLICNESMRQLEGESRHLIEIGKSPGLVLISVINFAELSLTANSKIRRLI